MAKFVGFNVALARLSSVAFSARGDDAIVNLARNRRACSRDARAGDASLAPQYRGAGGVRGCVYGASSQSVAGFPGGALSAEP